MSLRRFNELRGEEVVYAVQRQDRTFLPSQDHCPPCPTRPGRPPTKTRFGEFEIVVLNNRFPAFEAPDGAAEVVVYTDQHHGSFAALAPARAEALTWVWVWVWVWRQRYEELGARPDVEYVFIFENRGVEVGPRCSTRTGRSTPSRSSPRSGARACGRRSPRRVRSVHAAAPRSGARACGRRSPRRVRSVHAAAPRARRAATDRARQRRRRRLRPRRGALAV